MTPRSGGDPRHALKTADQALYAAKSAGRDRVVVASQATASASEVEAGKPPKRPLVARMPPSEQVATQPAA